MKPSAYWQALTPEEKQQLCDATKTSKVRMANIFHGNSAYASPKLASIIKKHVDPSVDVHSLMSPANRKAIKELK